MKQWLALQFLTLGLIGTVSAQSPFIHEGFNSLALPPGWTQTRLAGSQAAWSVVGQGTNPYVAPYQGSGQVKFNSFDALSGEQARLVSRPISLTSSVDPFLTFFLYHDDEYATAWDSLYVEITTGDSIAGPWTVLLGHRRPASSNGWKKELVSLYSYRGIGRLFIGLRGVSKYGNNIFVDEIRIADSSFYDISATGIVSISGPISQRPTGQRNREVQTTQKPTERVRGASTDDLAAYEGAPLTLRAYLRNLGTVAASGYTVGWRVNSLLQTPVGGPILTARTGYDSVTLSWNTPIAGSHSITVWTNASADSNRKNDTVHLHVQVLDTATVFFESFNRQTFPPDGWLTINRDGGGAAPWFRGADTSAFVAFEGAGYAANNFQRANGIYLDDYLITPSLTSINPAGRADSLIFWVRSALNAPPFANFPDSLMVMLSTTGADTAHFTTILDYFLVPKGFWTRKGYSLQSRVPANSSIRIAFRYLLGNVQPNAGSGDFIGIDAVQLVRKLPTNTGSDFASIPSELSLFQNYPNPFNPSTTITFSIPVGTGHGPSLLKVYDLLGREVTTLVNEQLQPGNYSVAFNAANLSSGVYLYRLHAGGFTMTRKMLLLR